MFDPEAFGVAMAELIEEAVAPLQKEVADLKRQLAEKPDFAPVIREQVATAVAQLPAVKDGKDGVDCDMETIKGLIEVAVKAIPAPKDGKDGAPGTNGADGVNGKDGSSVTIKDLEGMIKDEVRNWTEGLPVPKDGRDGIDGKAGTNGLDGKSVTVEDVLPLVREAVASIPVPKDGKDGIDGKNGEKGADGLGLAGAMIDRDGALQITMTNGEVKGLGPVVGKDGLNGKDGADGASLDAFELEYLPETHEIAVKAACGARAKEIRYPAGGLRPGGYWREGTKAKANEAWVHDGSLWIAKCDTPAKPETQSQDWIIGARKGRDGETIVKTVNGGPPAPIKLEA